MSGDETTSGTPSLLGSYRLERLIGRGGMGAVFLAYDTTLHRRVAVKMLEESAQPGISREKLLREARSAASLNHPNICTIHEVGSAGGAAYIAMEFVDGEPLRDRIDRGPLPLDQVIAIARQAAAALDYAHANGVVHRDFKAANIILSDTGHLKIVDFGLARREDAAESTMLSAVPAGTPAGTPYAMAPEQVRGDRADARADIWALGVLLYEMSAGQKPFAAPSVPELFSAILRDAPRPLPDSVPATLRAIIARCLEKDPGGRYPDAGAVRAALDQIGPASEWSRRLWPVAAVITLAVTGLTVWTNQPMRDRAAAAPAEAATSAPIRLAVLPFNNLTGDAEQEYFVDGLTEEAITELGRLHPQRLNVIGRTSSMRYKNASLPIEQIGKELAVDYVLEGSARREGNRVRVTARLLRARGESQIWTDSFERELASMLSLQSDVARGVASSLTLRLLPEEERRLMARRPVNPEAYEAYLRGNGHAGKLSRADLDRALEYFELALQKDPQFALAHVGVSRVWSGRQQMQYAPPRVAGPRIRAALMRANEIDGDLPEVHHALAGLYTWTDWNWVEGGKEFDRALALRPNFAEARAFHAHYLMIMRRPDEGVAEMQRALSLDPFNDLIQALAGTVFTLVERYDEAIAQFENALETSPGNTVALNGLARALHHAGRHDEALEADRKLWTARGDEDMVRVLSDPSTDYDTTLRRAATVQAARAAKSGTAPLFIAILYMRARAYDEALQWLQRSFDAHDPNVPYIAVGPNWQDLRDDARFAAIHRKLGLP